MNVFFSILSSHHSVHGNIGAVLILDRPPLSEDPRVLSLETLLTFMKDNHYPLEVRDRTHFISAHHVSPVIIALSLRVDSSLNSVQVHSAQSGAFHLVVIVQLMTGGSS